MKIRKLHIKNYKVFNDLELDFTDANGRTLDKIVLAGVNGTGKTTILELIRKMFDRTLFSYPEEGIDANIILEIELLDSEKTAILKALNQFKRLISDEAEKDFFAKFILYLTKPYKYFSFNFNGQAAFNPLDTFFMFAESQNNNKKLPHLLYLPIYTKEREEELIALQKRDSIKKLQSEENGILHIVYLESTKNKMKTLALNSVRNEIYENMDTPPRKSIENAIKKINKPLEGLALSTKLVDSESEELVFRSINGQRIHFEDLSNGEKILYFRCIYLVTLTIKDSIIMVDEPEDALHPTWQQGILKLYQNIGENNQVIVATHSPHIIGSANAEEVFLLEIDENRVGITHPRYTKGHSIDYILEVMGANPRNTSVIGKVDAYLALVRKGLSETEQGRVLKAEIDAFNLDPNSEEMRRLDLSLKRFKAVGV